MKGFTRLYAEGGDIVNQFYSTGAVGSADSSSAWPGDKKKKGKCRGGKCTTKQPPGLGGRPGIKWKGLGKTKGFQ